MQVQPFDPTMEIPYYYPCNLPLIHETLKQQGSLSSLGLIANSRMYGLPACSSAGLVKSYFHKLDYEDPIWIMKGRVEYSGLEEGLNEVRKRVSKGELLLATGTSYYLPYCEDYLNAKYIEKLVEPASRLYLADHWLAVYGIDDDHLMIYDPVPSRYKGPISLKSFDDFWKGNKNIPELAQAKIKEELHTYCVIDIQPEEKLTTSSYQEVLLRTLATQAYEFLFAQEVREGDRIYYFGHAVSLQLLKTLHLGMAEGKTAANTISGFLFDMRWSRYFFRDLLEELAVVLGSTYVSYASEFNEIIAEWEGAHKLLQGRGAASQSAERALLLSTKLETLLRREYQFYETVWSAHKSVGLFRKRANHSRETGFTKRETLLRIVLDSCMDLNQFHNGTIAVELGSQAPLYGRNGNLDSLGLVSLLASVEQGIEEELGVGLALSAEPSSLLADSPYRTVDSLVGYLYSHLDKAV